MIFSPKAIIFDLNGTMINDMEFHNKAWFNILNELHANMSYEDVKKQMYGKNEELLERVFGKNYFSQQQMDEIALKKEKSYQKDYLPELKLMPGLENFLRSAKEAGILMAIGSAAIPFNINFVLDGLNIQSYFSTVISANDVKISKPNPETFLKAANVLMVKPSNCLVFEDAPKGVEAALNAGMPCIAITSTHLAEEFLPYNNVIGIIEDYNDPIITQLINSF